MSHSDAIRRIVVPKRRWFQFSLRTVLVLLTVFGIWLGLHVRRTNRQKEAVAAIEAFGGSYYYGFQKYDGKTGQHDPNAKSWVPKWLLANLGLDFFHDVEALSLVFRYEISKRPDNYDLAVGVLPYLDGFPDLRDLALYNFGLTDEGMTHICRLTKLESLGIWHTSEITDSGADHLKSLRNLKSLHLDSNSRLTDETLKALGQLPRLETLSLKGQFTNEGLSYLQDMKQLKTLVIERDHSKIAGQGMVVRGGLTKLETLDLKKKLAAKGLDHSTELKNLK